MVCTAAPMEQPEQFARSWYREGVGLLQGPSWQQVNAGAHLRDFAADENGATAKLTDSRFAKLLEEDALC